MLTNIHEPNTPTYGQTRRFRSSACLFVDLFTWLFRNANTETKTIRQSMRYYSPWNPHSNHDTRAPKERKKKTSRLNSNSRILPSSPVSPFWHNVKKKFSPSFPPKMKGEKAEFWAGHWGFIHTNSFSQHTRAEIPKLSARSRGLATSGGVDP